MNSKINKDTRVIFVNQVTGDYSSKRLGSLKKDEVPVCTINHAQYAICKVFEELFPNMESNPLYQDVDWREIRKNLNKKSEEK